MSDHRCLTKTAASSEFRKAQGVDNERQARTRHQLMAEMKLSSTEASSSAPHNPHSQPGPEQTDVQPPTNPPASSRRASDHVDSNHVKYGYDSTRRHTESNLHKRETGIPRHPNSTLRKAHAIPRHSNSSLHKHEHDTKHHSNSSLHKHEHDTKHHSNSGLHKHEHDTKHHSNSSLHKHEHDTKHHSNSSLHKHDTKHHSNSSLHKHEHDTKHHSNSSLHKHDTKHHSNSSLHKHEHDTKHHSNSSLHKHEHDTRQHSNSSLHKCEDDTKQHSNSSSHNHEHDEMRPQSNASHHSRIPVPVARRQSENSSPKPDHDTRRPSESRHHKSEHGDVAFSNKSDGRDPKQHQTSTWRSAHQIEHGKEHDLHKPRSLHFNTTPSKGSRHAVDRHHQQGAEAAHGQHGQNEAAMNSLYEKAIDTVKNVDESRFVDHPQDKHEKPTDSASLDLATIKELEEVLQEVQTHTSRRHIHDDHVDILDYKAQMKRIKHLEDILKSLSTEPEKKVDFDPMKVLQCKYLRLSKSNIETMEAMLRKQGRDPGIHAHSDVGQVDVWAGLKEEIKPPETEAVATSSRAV